LLLRIARHALRPLRVRPRRSQRLKPLRSRFSFAALIGEIGFVLERSRSTDLRAEVGCSIRQPHGGAWQRLAAQEPPLARSMACCCA